MAESVYQFASVPKKTSNAGRPKGKKAYIVYFRWNDVKTYNRDEKGVRVKEFALAESRLQSMQPTLLLTFITQAKEKTMRVASFIM